MLFGLIALFIGTAVYVLDRSPSESFVPAALSYFALTPTVFGTFGHSLPTFTHVFAFALLTAVLLNGVRGAAVSACLAWGVLEAVFEVGQHARVAAWLVERLPQGADSNPLLAKTVDYFRYGTFDPGDLLAIVLGALAAYVVIQQTQRQARPYD